MPVNEGLDLNNKIYTVKETAEILRVSIRTVRRWINSGCVQVVRISPIKGSRVLITAQEIERLVVPGGSKGGLK